MMEVIFNYKFLTIIRQANSVGSTQANSVVGADTQT